ncbi:hypothetical protein ElP_75910 (plasmid) [Tautonia plasticadhaerens]|uniref:Uncharacterized protein n=1 Tax=Tautonia plasticadhaerens TaxID=2527974 RepID=A0A518HFJ5_9BACT|nr:hypothetical protein [Tautonia plasticadhaerens]QDV39619.1 hypothetical protein ElP_75910 [Tautonia plasticadhaerens]
MLAGLLPLLADQAQQGRLGGEQHASLLEEFAGPGQQRGRLLQAAGFLEDEACQGRGLVGVEDGEPQVVSDACLMVRDRMLPGGVPLEPGRVDAQLQGDETQEFVADLQGLLGWEAAEEPDEAELIGEPEAVVFATAPGDLGQSASVRVASRTICARANESVAMGGPRGLENGRLVGHS